MGHKWDITVLVETAPAWTLGADLVPNPDTYGTNNPVDKSF